MTLNKRITLLKLRRANGSGGYETAAEKKVYASVSDIGVTTKYTAVSAGREAELQAVVWRSEFLKDSYTHIEYKGEKYRIDSTGRAENDRFIKLILAKGG